MDATVGGRLHPTGAQREDTADLSATLSFVIPSGCDSLISHKTVAVDGETVVDGKGVLAAPTTALVP
jgi:hypothetical protein